MITSRLKDIDTIYAYADGAVRELTQVMCNGQELWSSFVPFTKSFGYTGGMQSFAVPATGLYKLEAWGAQGGTNYSFSYYGGIVKTYGAYKGGYSIGYKLLKKGDVLYIGVGGKGADSSFSSYVAGGAFNGGGACVSARSAGGGGATHIAINQNVVLSGCSAANVLIVAGGSGGSGGCVNGASSEQYYNWGGAGGYGGGSVGGAGTTNINNAAYKGGGGGTQTSGGSGGNADSKKGTFGKGGDGTNYSGYNGCHGTGGGGFYGGGQGAGSCGGGGGSGYIGGASSIVYRGIPYPSATSANYNSGNGKASITRVA